MSKKQPWCVEPETATEFLHTFRKSLEIAQSPIDPSELRKTRAIIEYIDDPSPELRESLRTFNRVKNSSKRIGLGVRRTLPWIIRLAEQFGQPIDPLVALWHEKTTTTATIVAAINSARVLEMKLKLATTARGPAVRLALRPDYVPVAEALAMMIVKAGEDERKLLARIVLEHSVPTVTMGKGKGVTWHHVANLREALRAERRLWGREVGAADEVIAEPKRRAPKDIDDLAQRSMYSPEADPVMENHRRAEQKAGRR